MKLSIATAFLTATAAAFSPAGQVSDLYDFIDLMVGENGKKNLVGRLHGSVVNLIMDL